MTTVEDFLAHHGTKGMKWGVRKDAGHVGERATTKKIGKLDAKFEKTIARANNGQVTMELHNSAVRRINARVDALNDSDKYRNVDLSTYHGKLKNDYEKDAQEAIMRSMEDAVREVHGSNASGTKKAVYNRDTDTIDIVDRSEQAEHADLQKVPDVTVHLKRNQRGLIGSVEVTSLVTSVSHSEGIIENFLEHHGTKGMKWGVRRDGSGSGGSSSKKTAKEPAHVDAAGTHELKGRAKKSGTDALSNAELKKAVERMNLEQQYSRLAGGSGGPRKTASKFISDQLKSIGRQQVGQLGNQLAAKQVAKLLAKSALG